MPTTTEKIKGLKERLNALEDELTGDLEQRIKFLEQLEKLCEDKQKLLDDLYAQSNRLSSLIKEFPAVSTAVGGRMFEKPMSKEEELFVRSNYKLSWADKVNLCEMAISLIMMVFIKGDGFWAVYFAFMMFSDALEVALPLPLYNLLTSIPYIENNIHNHNLRKLLRLIPRVLFTIWLLVYVKPKESKD